MLCHFVWYLIIASFVCCSRIQYLPVFSPEFLLRFWLLRGIGVSFFRSQFFHYFVIHICDIGDPVSITNFFSVLLIFTVVVKFLFLSTILFVLSILYFLNSVSSLFCQFLNFLFVYMSVRSGHFSRSYCISDRLLCICELGSSLVHYRIDNVCCCCIFISVAY